jgi:hypothetical protein
MLSKVGWAYYASAGDDEISKIQLKSNLPGKMLIWGSKEPKR